MEPIIVRKAQQADIPAILEIEWSVSGKTVFQKSSLPI